MNPEVKISRVMPMQHEARLKLEVYLVLRQFRDGLMDATDTYNQLTCLYSDHFEVEKE